MFDSLAKAGKYLGQAARAAAKFVRQALNDSTFSNAARKVSGVSVTGR